MQYSDRGRVMITIDRGDYWHCGFPVPKGTAAKMRAGGIEDFRSNRRNRSIFARSR
jgi:hypothetical protein